MTDVFLIGFALLVWLFFYEHLKGKRLLNILRIKRKGRKRTMPYMIEKFIGKDCLINLGSGGTADGIVRSVTEGWIELEDAQGKLQAVNVDYISRIREYPKNKSGKRKLVVE